MQASLIVDPFKIAKKHALKDLKRKGWTERVDSEVENGKTLAKHLRNGGCLRRPVRTSFLKSIPP
jgi:hypothetical protein